MRTALTGTDGSTFDLAALAGRVVVISDMMTLCQETCPLDTANVLAAARAVQRAGLGRKVVFLSITIDPERDTLAQLTAYRKLYGPVPADWIVARPLAPEAAAFWRRLGVFIQRVRDKPPFPVNWRTHRRLSYDLTHSDEVFFLDTRGRERFLLEGAPHVARAAQIPAALSRFMDSTGHRNVTHPDPQAWTLRQELAVLSWLTQRQLH